MFRQIRPLIAFLIFINQALIPVAVEAADKEEITRLINEGINYHSNRNYLLSIKSFKRAFDLDPDNEQIASNLSIAHNNYGKYLAERTDGKGAAREFRHAIYFDPSNNVARANLEYKLKELNIEVGNHVKRILEAKKERIAENFYAAIAELREANRLKESVEAYLEIGVNYHLLSLKTAQDVLYVENAIEAFSKASDIDSDDPRPYIRLGDVHVANGRVNKGIDFYERAIRKDPDNQEAQSALINGWLAALRIAPHLANNHVGLGTAYQLKGDFVQAERSFRRALQIDAGNKLALNGLESLEQDRIKTQVNLFLDRAVSFQKKGNLDQSLTFYIKALNLEPTNPDIHYNIGTAFQAKEDFVRARKAYAKAVELYPKHDEAKKALIVLEKQEQENHIAEAFEHAVKLQAAGNYAEAIVIYERLKVDRPTDDSLFYNLAVAHQALGDYDESIVSYQKANSLREDPAYTDAIQSVQIAKANSLLAKAIELQGAADNDAAISNYEQVVELVPSNANAWYNLGTAYQAVGRDTKALYAYTKAYELDEENQTEAMFFAALILEDQRKLIEAIGLYEKYLVLSPNGDYSAEARERGEYIKSFL